MSMSVSCEKKKKEIDSAALGLDLSSFRFGLAAFRLFATVHMVPLARWGQDR